MDYHALPVPVMKAVFAGCKTEARTEGHDLLLQQAEAEVGQGDGRAPGGEKKVIVNKRTGLPFPKGK